MMRLPVSNEFHITAAYGETGSLWKNGHKGIDFVTTDKKIYSPCDGTVRVIAFDEDGWGQYISIGDADGRHHILCHLVKGSVLVKTGQKIKKGTHIATMGATGNVTGVHLHYQVNIDGLPVNPAVLLGIENKRGVYTMARYNDDAAISSWARDAVEKVSAAGLMEGDEKGNFNPKESLTREQAAVILARLISKE